MNRKSTLWQFCVFFTLILYGTRFVEASPQQRFSFSVVGQMRRMHGYMDSGGRAVIDAVFRIAEPFESGLAVVATGFAGSRFTEFAVIDVNGEFVLPPEYDAIQLNGREHAWVLHDGMWSFIDIWTREPVFSERFERAGVFSEGKAVVERDERQFVIDEAGRELFGLSDRGIRIYQSSPYAGDVFRGYQSYYQDGRLLCIVDSSERGLRTVVFLDEQGDVIIPKRTCFATHLFSFSEGYAAVKEGRYRGDSSGDAYFIDRYGNRAFEGENWIDVKPFSDGLAAVRILDRDGDPEMPRRWGFIDRSGKFVIEPEYADVRPFSEGLAAVAVELERPGLAWSRQGLWGAIDRQGNVVIKPQFRMPFVFRDGLARVIEPVEIYSRNGTSLDRPLQGSRMRYFDANGRIVWDERDINPVE